MPRLNIYDTKAISFKKTIIFLVLGLLAVIPPLPFIGKGYNFLQVINLSIIPVVVIAFEFGFVFSYFITGILSFIIIRSLQSDRDFAIPYLISLVFLNLIPLVPGYLNHAYNWVFMSKDEALRRAKKDFGDFETELKALGDLNLSLQNQVHEILDLYEVTKKMSASLDMAETLKAFGNAVNNFVRFRTIKVIFFDESKGQSVISVTYEILNRNPGNLSNSDIKKTDPAQFDQILTEAISSRREAIYLKPPLEESHPLKQFLTKSSESFVAIPLLSEGVPIGILTITGLEEEKIENFSILAEQLALEIKKIKLYDRIQELAITDSLTGIYVRRHFLERFSEEVTRSQRHSLKFSVLMIDLDHFKDCNDTHGHLVGDIVLKEIAKIMRSYTRQVDLLGRYGGEEFIIALPDTDKSFAANAAERLRQSIEKNQFKAYDELLKMTISIGISTFPDDGTDIETLIDRADQALYKAKEEGRNRVIIS